jgi:hypothetical protein
MTSSLRWSELPYTEAALAYPYTLRVHLASTVEWSASLSDSGCHFKLLGYFDTKEAAREAAIAYLQQELSELLVTLARREG